MLYPQISESIIGRAMKVINTLKPGLIEKLYERALVIGLEKKGHKVDQQEHFPVLYDGQRIGTLIPDLIVDGKVIVDAKVVESFHDSQVAKMIGYLTITKLKLALLVNFKNARLEWKRVAR